MKIPASVLYFSMLVISFYLPAHAYQAPSPDSKYAPLPDKVANAKSVFYINDTGNSRFGDDMYQELKKWNHWRVVTDKE